MGKFDGSIEEIGIELYGDDACLLASHGLAAGIVAEMQLHAAP